MKKPNVASSIIAAALSLLAASAEARVFDFKNEKFAAYVGGTFGRSNAGDGAYALASGYGTQFDKSVQSASSAEGGIVFVGTRFTFKFGVEYLMPRDQVGITGTDQNGNTLFTLDAKMSAFIPQFDLEYMFLVRNTSHGYIGAGWGAGTVSISNEYHMTAAGTSALGVGDYKEMASGWGAMAQAYLGWEFLFSDVVTCAAHVGYRYLHAQAFTATQDATAISGNETNGQEIHNMDGSNRAVDLGGVFAGVGFRFYL